MHRNTIPYIIIVFAFGLSLPFWNVVLFPYLVILLGFLLIISVGLLLFSSILGKRSLAWSFYLGFPVLVCFCVFTINRFVRHQKAEKVVSDIENYRLLTGKLPENLKELNTLSIIGLTYKADSLGQTYSIEYNMEQFNAEYYNSDSKMWVTRGWND